MLTDLAAWLQTTSLSAAAAGGVPWLWPACETLHFIGMAMLFGCVGVLDARMLGMAKRLPVEPLGDLVGWGVAGFVINLATGVAFVVGKPGQYVGNVAFGMKMLFILLAGLNVAAFYALGIQARTSRLGAGDDAPASAKVVAALSLLLWVGVMYWGRMLPFVGDAF